MKEHLYRHFNKDGVLLYVGISASAIRRLAEHEAASHWFCTIETVRIEHFEDRASAMAAERKAIRSEKPLHNILRYGLKEKQIEREISRIDRSRVNLLQKTAAFKLMYTKEDVASELRISVEAVKRLIEKHELGKDQQAQGFEPSIQRLLPRHC